MAEKEIAVATRLPKREVSSQLDVLAPGGARRFWSSVFRDYQRYLTPLALVVLVIGVASVSEHFLTVRNLTNILHQAAVMTIVSVGMTYLIIAGGFDLSVGSVVALSGSIGALVMLRAGIFPGVLGGLLAGVAVGLVNGSVVNLLGVSPFITTLGTMVLIRGIVLLVTGGLPVDGIPDSFTRIGTEAAWGIPYAVMVSGSLFIIFLIILRYTPFGVKVYAIGGNREAALLSGINVNRVGIAAFGICGGLAGAAGLLLAARLRSGQPTAGEFYELTSIAMVVLGGASLSGGEGKLTRTLLGVMIIQVMTNGLNLMNVHPYWQRVLVGLILIGAATADRLRRR